jgi:hypothetical protein
MNSFTVSGKLEKNCYGFSLDQGSESEYFDRFLKPFEDLNVKVTIEEVTDATESVDKLKNALLGLFIRHCKNIGAFNKYDFYTEFKRSYGFTGDFSGLDLYMNEEELSNAVEELW